MTRRNLKMRSSAMMAKSFLRRLDEGLILDRTKRVDKNHRPTIDAPRVLTRRTA